MQIAIFRETESGEKRVALVPETVKKLVSNGNKIFIESGAGLQAGFSNSEYETNGATIFTERKQACRQAQIILALNRPANEILFNLPTDCIVIGLLKPLDETKKLKEFIQHKITAFSLEMIPRTTKAQSSDVLSTMATVAGYKAVLWASDNLPKMFPMLTTAAGTIPPAKVLVIGAGVAGLQAIATARRLGAMVEGFDIRAAAGEAVRSLGARFLELENINAEGEGGYAKEIGEREMEMARELISNALKTTDCVVTTAQIPGRKSPLLITRQAVEQMPSGSVIIDLAGANGGNCELSRLGEIVVHQGVKIFSPTNLAAEIPLHASQLFSRNLFNFLNLLIKDGELNLDFSDEIISGSCIVHNGEIRQERIKALYQENLAESVKVGS